MVRIIAIANEKGGVGKTTTASALCAGFAREGLNTLAVDIDSQGNLTSAMNAPASENTTYEVLMQKCAPHEGIVKLSTHLTLMPASKRLSLIDMELSNALGREYRLREAIERLGNKLDYVVIDTPPALGALTANALTAAHEVIIPCQADKFSLDGIGALVKSINMVKRYSNPILLISGILLVRHNARTVLGRDVEESLSVVAAAIHSKMFKARIHECIAIKESQKLQQDIFAYKPYCTAALDYEDLIREVLEHGKEL